MLIQNAVTTVAGAAVLLLAGTGDRVWTHRSFQRYGWCHQNLNVARALADLSSALATSRIGILVES